MATATLRTFMSRYNSIEGHWSPGMLYREFEGMPGTVTLDLIEASAAPAIDGAGLLAQRYGAYLAKALLAHAMSPGDLQRACITMQFNVADADPRREVEGEGDVFVCTIVLVGVDGRTVNYACRGRCHPWEAGRYN